MMNIIVDETLQKYLENGCLKKTLLEIRPIVLDIIKNIDDKTPIDAIEQVIYNVEQASSFFLSQKNFKDTNLIYGLSSSILKCGQSDWQLYFCGGKTNYDIDTEVDFNTPFDLASATKLFTLIAKDKLVEYGYFNDSDKIIDLLPEFINMEDFTIEDLSLLVGELRTINRIDEASCEKEALDILKSVYLHSNDRTVNKYTDIGAIILSKIIVKKYNEINKCNCNYNDILKELIFDKCDMKNTSFNPVVTVAGCGNNEGIVHDPKTRILGGMTGAAGLFSTPFDQVKFAKSLFNISDYDFINDLASPENIKKYGTVTFPNSRQANKGHLGIYQKNTTYSNFLCPRDYSDGCFSHAGYTGSQVIFDPTNKIHNSIFVGAVRPDLEKQYNKCSDYIINCKPSGFIDGFNTYQDAVTKNSLILSIVKDILDNYYEPSEIDIKIKVR